MFERFYDDAAHSTTRRVSCSAAAAAVRAGVNDVVPLDLLRRTFSAPELACLLGGVADISVAEWRKNTQYEGGYTQDSLQVQWLWRLVERFTPDERTLLLKFVTVGAWGIESSEPKKNYSRLDPHRKP